MTNTKQTVKTSWYRKLTLEHWGTIVGSLILFSSWIVDKNYQSEWAATRDKLQRSQLVVDIEEVHRSLYDLAYLHELKKQPVDSFSLAVAALGQTRTKLNLYTWGVGRVTDNADEYQQMIATKRQIIEISEYSLLTSDYKKLFEAHDIVTKVFTKNYMKNDASFSDKIDVVNQEQDKWDKRFFWLYVVGSFVLGVSYIYGRATEKRD